MNYTPPPATLLTLLSECHFWTTRDDVRIKAHDLGAFRYARNREQQQQQEHDVVAVAKRDYTERRNGIAVLKNRRKADGRLKDNIKKLEELLRMQKVVTAQWQDATQLLLLFSNGMIAHVCVDVYTGDISRMVYEKYLIGKLAADTITDAIFTRSHIVLAYNTNQLTVVYLQQPNTRPQGPEKIANMDARIYHVLIPGPAERKLARHLAVSSSFDLFIVWTGSSQNEVYPWRPTVRDQDRANIHVFKLKAMQLEALCYCWSENDPLCVDFLRSSESQLLVVEQKVSRKGEMTAEICTYELTTGKMQRSPLMSIPMGTQICCCAFSPDQEKLFLGTIDRNICLHDLVLQTQKFLGPIDIIPTQCTWHCDSSIILIANERSQMQCFDLALTPIGNQLQSEDVTPTNILDLSHYFAVQPTLSYVAFSRKPDLCNFTNTYAQTDCFLLLLYEHGPVACLRFFGGAGMRGDIHNSGLTADVIVDKYLALNQLEKAVNLLSALNWETYGAMCLITLHKIANYVFYRGEQRRMRVELINRALRTFTPALSEETKDEFSDQVFDLKRRCFFFLLRKNLYSEAFELAQDIEDYDLFMDLYNVTKTDVNLIEFSTAAFSQAAAILHEEDRANGNLSLIGDYRSESACSQSTCSDANFSQQQQQQQQHQRHMQNRSNALKNYVPPLPSFKSKVYNAEMIKINIPKPELRIDVQAVAHERARTHTISSSSNNQSNNNNNNNIVANSVVSTLANLSLKSGIGGGSGGSQMMTEVTEIQKTNYLNGNTNSVQWADVPDQTVGLPNVLSVSSSSSSTTITATTSTLNISTTRLSAFTPTNSNSNAHLSLPRSNQNQQQQQQQQQSAFMHYATPSYATSPPPLPPPLQSLPVVPIPTTYQPKFYQHPLVSGKIPSTLNAAEQIEQQKRLLLKKPTASILSNSNATQYGASTSLLAGSGTLNGTMHKEPTAGGKNAAGERNKVKFSDTVQVAVVPEIPRKDKTSSVKRNGYARPASRSLMNPKKELADSLPLCHPNDDYLKDFNPLSTETLRPPLKSSIKEDQTNSNNKSAPPAPPPSIKVVHFGVV